MARDRVFGIGLPFSARHSSNSTRSPRLFDWTARQADATTDTWVAIDSEILDQIERPGPKVAWLLESPAILAWQNISLQLKERLDEVPSPA